MSQLGEMRAACLVWPATRVPAFQLRRTGQGTGQNTPNFSCHLAHYSSTRFRVGWGCGEKTRGQTLGGTVRFLQRSHSAPRGLNLAQLLSICLLLLLHLVREGAPGALFSQCWDSYWGLHRCKTSPFPLRRVTGREGVPRNGNKVKRVSWGFSQLA